MTHQPDRDEPTAVSSDHQFGRRLQKLTIAWNMGEVFVTVTLGIISGSLALVAFGLDSLIEVFTSLVVLWHMSPAARADHTARDRRAARLVAISFGLLSAYLLVASTRSLIIGIEPDTSTPAIVYLSITAVVMIVLAGLKRRTGHRLESLVFLSEARMTQIDAYLATGILSALVLNSWLGWWWADPVAALAIALIAGNEALEGFRTKN